MLAVGTESRRLDEGQTGHRRRKEAGSLFALTKGSCSDGGVSRSLAYSVQIYELQIEHALFTCSPSRHKNMTGGS